MQTVNFDIGQLLKKTRVGQFLIPQFQRDFTWKEGQTRLLIDSIARNYPIGSLLILGKNDQIPLKSRKLSASYCPSEEGCFDEPNSESYYVLDGQQRLTSIVRVFLDAHPKRNYYFDLKKMHENFKSESSSWIISRTRGINNPDRKDNNRLIRTDIALNQEKCDVYITEYIEDSGDFPQFEGDKAAARQAAAYLKGVFETIRKFSIPFVSLESDAPLESVCRVFETINSTGTRLTTFDLAVARYFPDPDLKDLFDGSKEKHQILNEYEIDGERVLQILSLYYLKMEARKFPEATRSVILSLEPDFINKNWNKAAESLKDACEWVKKLGASAKNQPPHGILVSVAAAIMCFPELLSKTGFQNSLRKWYFSSTLSKSTSPANNYKIGSDFQKLCESDFQYPSVYFSTTDILGIKHTSDGRYKAIQALMHTTIKEDLITGSALGDDIEDHHIFPYSLSKSGFSKEKLNSIANRILVSKSTNREINSRTPSNYLKDLISSHEKEGNVLDLKRRLSMCFIPYGNVSSDFYSNVSQESFSEFLEKRAQMIVDRIKEVVGDAWKEPNHADEDSPEDLDDEHIDD